MMEQILIKFMTELVLTANEAIYKVVGKLETIIDVVIYLYFAQ